MLIIQSPVFKQCHLEFRRQSADIIGLFTDVYIGESIIPRGEQRGVAPPEPELLDYGI